MENQQWKYKIGAGKTPVFLSLGMAIVFGSVSVWLHKTGNGAYFFCDILTGIMGAVLLTTIYRLMFYKVLIGKNGFYFQTHIANGMYHNYGELKNAWITSGQKLSGHKNKWCHFETADGKITRFLIYYNDEKAAAYLVKCTQADTAAQATDEVLQKQQYRIDGRASGVAGVVNAFAAVGLICVFEFPMFQLGGAALAMGLIGLLIAAFVLVSALFSYFCFQIKIEAEGFYYQTTPFNGSYFNYQDIDRCWEVKRVYRYRRNATRNHYFYLYFTDRQGKTRRFQYENDIYGFEVNILKQRIKSK